ncbi:hypothetical protein KJ840_02390 [Patescibacteria group bacterium]|nr:hypothetical protein [Patescibacteria group bacterium]
MKKHKTKILLASLISIILITAGFLYFSLINTKEIYAEVGGEGTACITHPECNPPYWNPGSGQTGICGYGYGYKSCTIIDDCSPCGESVPTVTSLLRACNSGVCQVRFAYDIGPPFNYGPWLNCYQCYSYTSGGPPPQQPDHCYITDNDYNHALYIEDSSGNTVFAFTDAGQILTTMGITGISDVGNYVGAYFGFTQGNTFPIYNQDNVLIAFIGNYLGEGYRLFVRSIHEYQNGILVPLVDGNFIIENSFSDIVSYIDSNGNLYMIGCVSELQHFQ